MMGIILHSRKVSVTEQTNIQSRIMAQEPVASSPAWVNTATPLPTQQDETLVMKEKEETNNSTLTEKAKKLTRKSVIHLHKYRWRRGAVCVCGFYMQPQMHFRNYFIRIFFLTDSRTCLSTHHQSEIYVTTWATISHRASLLINLL